MTAGELLRRLRLRARCYALRVETVDRLESERNDAVRERDLIRVANERLADRPSRAESVLAQRDAIAVAEETYAVLRSLQHRVTGDLANDVDHAIDVERERRGQDHVAVARALGLTDPARYAFELGLLLTHARSARLGQERYDNLRAVLLDYLGFASSSATDDEIVAALVRAGAGLRPRRCGICGCTDDDCSMCLASLGETCTWTDLDLCSRCADTARVQRAGTSIGRAR